MGLFKSIKAAREAAREFNARGGPSPEALAALTPEQRAAYEAQMARVQEEIAKAQAAVAGQPGRALGGAAGVHVHGPDPTTAPLTFEGQLAASKEQLRDVLENPLGRPARPPAQTGPLLEGAERERQLAAERAARDEARAPYLAPVRHPVAFTRLATTGKTQVEEVAAYLGESGLVARPDLAYGVYRVPDRIRSGIRSEKRGIVEWDVVHAATEPLPPVGAPAAVARFAARDTWVARTPGAPSVLDEDLALAYAGYAQLAPEHCLGFARHLVIADRGDEDSASYTISQVVGVNVFHAPGLGAGISERMEGAAPLSLPAATPEGFHIEVLNWRAIAEAVHPQTHKRYPIPSPFPYLPSTPQELLQAYLEIVGVSPADSYAAQVTESAPIDIRGRGRAGFMSYSTNVGEKLPCADGEKRRRLHGGSRIVLVHRDTPGYAEGRARWARYCAEVLQADLAAPVRRPVESLGLIERLPTGVRGLAKAADWWLNDDDAFDDIPPHRYCWPPQKPS